MTGPEPVTNPTALAEERKRIINRLKRLEGQIRGLQSMIESEKDCEDILTQVMAAKSALDQVGLHIIRHAMHECLLDEANKSTDELVDEALDVFLKYVNCVR
ncbi:MAG: copper-sensing transcriptional repressor CsoR [Coriobacteriia bacterium]